MDADAFVSTFMSSPHGRAILCRVLQIFLWKSRISEGQDTGKLLKEFTCLYGHVIGLWLAQGVPHPLDSDLLGTSELHDPERRSG